MKFSILFGAPATVAMLFLVQLDSTQSLTTSKATGISLSSNRADPRQSPMLADYGGHRHQHHHDPHHHHHHVPHHLHVHHHHKHSHEHKHKVLLKHKHKHDHDGKVAHKHDHDHHDKHHRGHHNEHHDKHHHGHHGHHHDNEHYDTDASNNGRRTRYPQQNKKEFEKFDMKDFNFLYKPDGDQN